MTDVDKKRMTIMIGGGVFALVLAILLAMVLSANTKKSPRMNTNPTGLQVTVGEAPSVNMQKNLRCFVNGEFVGQYSLAECAKKNGVAAQALEVGLDENNQPTAAPTASLAPPPAKPIKAALGAEENLDGDGEPKEIVPRVSGGSGPVAACLRYLGGEWHQLSGGITQGQCAALLYDTRCERPGSASYGRWGEKTLRLIPGRVEVSDDNKNFRTYVEQGQGCTVPVR